jgi:hypothetical protein
MLSGRLQGFIPQNLADFEVHTLTLHTVRSNGGQDCWVNPCSLGDLTKT